MKYKRKPLFVACGIALASMCLPGIALADDSAEIKALKAQIEALRQKVDELAAKQANTEVKQQKMEQVVSTSAASASGGEPRFQKFLEGFYGNIDVSLDDTTKGMNGLAAIAYNVTPGPTGLILGPGTSPKGAYLPVGRMGYMPALSTNKSVIGYKGEHQFDGTDTSFIYQIETALTITAAPGANASNDLASSDQVKGAVGSGDSFVGFHNPTWGTLRIGVFYGPYKASTDRMNPFSGMLGDYAVIMGNTGGDNRVEFGTRFEHAIGWYSPTFGGGFTVNAMVSPGQNRTYDNQVQSAGSVDCNGGNVPGSGNLPDACTDGGFGDAYSMSLNYDNGPFYATMAYENHQGVNRSSDGIGSPYQIGPTTAPGYTSSGVNTDSLGNFLNDVATETAFKVGAQYRFDVGQGLTLSGIWETMHRNVPSFMEFQNERQRTGYWLAASQKLTSYDTVSAGWAHAGKSQGDPGGQHNYNPFVSDDHANMITVAWVHQLDKQFSLYADWAETINHQNAHYDLGAGGRGITTDCHDATNFGSQVNTVNAAGVPDGSSNGPTTWGGCRPMGISVGMRYRF
jgi:predicted porin